MSNSVYVYIVVLFFVFHMCSLHQYDDERLVYVIFGLAVSTSSARPGQAPTLAILFARVNKQASTPSSNWALEYSLYV
jgi:hypothetical protein